MTRLRYFGIQTKWYLRRWVVWAPELYLLMLQACLLTYTDTRPCIRSREPFTTGLKSGVLRHGLDSKLLVKRSIENYPKYWMETSLSLSTVLATLMPVFQPL